MTVSRGIQGAAGGAAAGSAILPGWGTLAGAGLGFLGGMLSDDNSEEVQRANAAKLAAMRAEAQKLEAYRPIQNAAFINAMRARSTAYQPSLNAMATMYGPSMAEAPAGLNYNPLSSLFPQNTLHMRPGAGPIPGNVAPTSGPSGGSFPARSPLTQAMAGPNPADAAMLAKKKALLDGLKIRAALGDYQPGNVAPVPGPDPYASAMRY